MATPVYVGDEIGATGFRLAGLRVHVPLRGEEAAALGAARADAPLVLVSAAVAERIGDDVLREAQAALAPLVLIVPDLVTGTPAPNLAARLRKQLGLEA